MGVKPDHWIVTMCSEHGMIEPFEPVAVRGGVSYGPSSYGYDFRLADEFQIPPDPTLSDETFDPHDPPADRFERVTADSIVIPAGGYILGRSLEYFRIPRDILTICTGKSTYARLGLIVNVTPFEPEWEGFATLSLVNGSGHPLRVHAGEGIAQLVFLIADEICQTSYADKGGKYQAQQEITHARRGDLPT